MKKLSKHIPLDLGNRINEQHAELLDKAISCLGDLPFLHNRDERHHNDILMLPDGSYVEVRTVRRAENGGMICRYETVARVTMPDDTFCTLGRKSIAVDISLPSDEKEAMLS